MTWSLATYQRGDIVALAVLREDGALVGPTDLKRWANMLELLEDWADAEGILRELDVEGAPAVDYDTLLAPVRYPRKIVCAGVNYAKHLREMGGEVAEGWTPFFFLKPPTTTVIGPTDPILIHRPETARYDWEVELAVVIGVGGRDIAQDDAMSHVAGYCAANDITARGQHKRTTDTVPADAFIYDWFASKSVDGSFPLGPGITPAFQIQDPQNLQLRLWVNGKLEQDESTSDMICPIPELISYASKVVTLEPGDVISTGTPSGVGSSRGLYLRDGDVVRVSIESLGTLENHIVEALERTS